MLNQVGQRSTSRCSNSLAFGGRLLPAGGRLGIAHKSRGGHRGFQVLCSRRLKFDGFHDIGDPNLATVLERRLSPQDMGLTQLIEREPENPSVLWMAISNSSPLRMGLRRW